MKYTVIFSALFALALAAPQGSPCECEEVICILSFPEGCYCRNDADRACYEKCGGVKPTYQDCSVDPVKPPQKRYDEPYARCGSLNLRCAEGETCIEDPFLEPGNCGITCDNGTGYCVPDNMCGGIVGFECPAGQDCAINRGVCDPDNGGSDCAGTCYDPQRLARD